MPNPENLKGKGFESRPEDINRKGRPKGALGRATIARHWLAALEKSTNPITNETETLTQEDRITLALIKKALKGDVNAYKALMDSGYGAPKQEVEQIIIDKTPPTITFIDNDEKK